MLQYIKFLLCFFFLQEINTDARVGVIINAENDANVKSDINKIVLAALSALSPENAILFVRKVLKEANAALIADNKFEIEVRHVCVMIYTLTITIIVTNLI